MLDIFTLVKMCNSSFDYKFSEVFSTKPGPRRENRLVSVYLKKPRTEVMHQDFFVRTCRVIYISSIDVTKLLGIKAQILRFFWSLFESKYSENNLCSYRIGWSCSNCSTLSIHKSHPLQRCLQMRFLNYFYQIRMQNLAH